jgi:tetratricopeptide (TPR) repeat protein
MSSIIDGYAYDIFISYRQKDNKYDGWVTGFVENLKRELEATFKEDVSVYFDINPHDGLLETHDVNASLKEKLKCLVFIPVISRTYCDPKSFAWEHEFKAFIEQASQEQYGLMIKLPNGNVTSRVLPVRIHDLESEDITFCESVLGGYLRGVEFIYKEPGVNKPLTAEDDDKKNINKTKYRIQINKTANAIKEIISGMMAGAIVTGKESPAGQMPWEEARKEKKIEIKEKPVGIKKLRILSGIFSVLILAALIGVYLYPKFFKRDELKRLIASGEQLTLAVFPFQNMTNDTTLNVLQGAVQMNLISALSKISELHVRQQETMNKILQPQGLMEYASISSGSAASVSKKLETDIFIYGSIQKGGTQIRLNANLVTTRTNEILKSFEQNGPYDERKLMDITDSLRKKITDFLIISKLIKKFNTEGVIYTNVLNPRTTSVEAYKFYIYGKKAYLKGDFPLAREWYRRALKADPNYFDAAFELAWAYDSQGFRDSCVQQVIKNYNNIDQWSSVEQLRAKANYAAYFEPPEVVIKILEQVVELDDQSTWMRGWLGEIYGSSNQLDKAISEFEKAIEISRKWGKQYLKGLGVYNVLGKAYMDAGQYKKAKKLFREAEEYTPDDDHIYYMQALLSAINKDTVAAYRYFNKSAALYKKKNIKYSIADSLDDLGWRNFIFGRRDSLEFYLRKGYAIDSNNVQRLFIFLVILGQPQAVSFDLEEYAKLQDKLMASEMGKDKVAYYDFLYDKGWTFYQKGRKKEALDILQRVWDEAPYKFYKYKSHLEEVKKAVTGQK